MKIDFGRGIYLEPDPEPRDSGHHKRIVGAAPLPGTQRGHQLTLECGHQPVAFGDLKQARGVVLCTMCRDDAEGAS